MNANELLLIMVALSAATLLAVSLRQGARTTKGWVAVAVFVMGGSLLLRWLLPAAAGYAALGMWLLLVIVPLGLARLAGRAVMGERYQRAIRLLRTARWLHPVDGWWNQHQLFRGLQLGNEGRLDEAAELLERFSSGDGALSRFAIIHGHRLLQRWGELAKWLRETVGFTELERSASLRGSYLRALGESGQLRALLDAYPALDRPLPASASLQITYCRLFLFAFSGRVEAVDSLLTDRLSMLPPRIRSYWAATARLALGDESDAVPLFEQQSTEGSENLRRAARWRLANRPTRADTVLTAEDEALLDRVEREMTLESHYAPSVRGSFRRSYLTHAILAVNLVVFGLEVAMGGAEDWDTLLRLGAIHVVPPYDMPWWRFFTATVLHFGWLHLVANMAALLLFAPFLEARLGRLRLLAVYLAAGLGGMGAAVADALVRGVSIGLVGASAGIMGLVGATAAVMTRGWLVEGARPAARRLSLLVGIVVVQAAIDLYIPEISFWAHFGGAVTGFVVGLLVARAPEASRPVAGTASPPQPG